MSENQNNSIIESYDGDPDELMFFQQPEEEYIEEYIEEGYADEDDFNIEETDTENMEIEESQTETINASTEKLTADKATNKAANPQLAHLKGNFDTSVDLNDPHYENFEIDPYYDLGVGPEPKAKTFRETSADKSEASVLGIISFSAGLGCLMFACCGFQYILSLGALVTGIWCLVLKPSVTRTRVFAIIGVICACLPYVMLAIQLFLTFGMEILENI